MNEKLFVYGLLKPQYYEPKSLTPARKAQISGDLFDIPNDAAAKNIGNSSHKIDGYVLEMPMAELLKIDKEEAPEFKRVKTNTLDNESVWVYEYLKDVPEDSKEVENWHKMKKVIKK